MTEIDKILFTSGLTVLGAVVVFVIGQVLSRFLIEPVQDLKRAIGEIRFNLSFHARAIKTPPARSQEKTDSAEDALLKSSCDLLRYAEAIPYYKFTRWLFFKSIPKRECISDASTHLRAITTYLSEKGSEATANLPEIRARMKRIRECLNVPDSEDDTY